MMQIFYRLAAPRILIWCMLLLVYFILYPQDITALLAPVDALCAVAMRLLGITMSISPWLYMFASVCVIAWTALCIMDRMAAKSRSATPQA
jgi:hypothetical protein